MQRTTLVVLTVLSSVAIAGCGTKDPAACDINRSLQGAYEDSGHTAPSSLLDNIDEYC